MRLFDFFVTEASLFSATASSTTGNALSQNARSSLENVEDLLRKVAATGNDPKLSQLINKFLVDIAPYLG